MTPDEIERAIILFYRSNRSDQSVNYLRPAGWLDKLSRPGLQELMDTLEMVWRDVNEEIHRRDDPDNRAQESSFVLVRKGEGK